jgi:hypothetical protein
MKCAILRTASLLTSCSAGLLTGCSEGLRALTFALAAEIES